MQNNMFSSVDCWWLWKEPVVQCVGSEKRRFWFTRCLKWCSFAFKKLYTHFAFIHAHNCFLHWPTASTFSGMLAHVALMRCLKLLVSHMCLVRCTHIPVSVAKFCSRPGFRINQTVWQMQIWRSIIRCFQLKELDCFTRIEWCQNASFPLQLFESK